MLMEEEEEAEPGMRVAVVWPVPEHHPCASSHTSWPTPERRSELGGGVSAAAADEAANQQDFLLGTDWQVDVTHLVAESPEGEDPKTARFLQGQVLMGLSPGTTKVLSPLSSAVLAERSVRVLDDKVSVTELGVQLVSGLSLSLQLSPGSSRAIVATATTQEVITQLKQESLISAWLQFSDGSMTPLDNYDPAHFLLAAVSLDDRVVAVQRSASWKWPVVVATGEGQGLLVRVEMTPVELCQKSRQRTPLATGVGNIRVSLGPPEGRPYGGGGQQGDRRGRRPDLPPHYGGSVGDMEAGIMNRGVAPTARVPRLSPPGRPRGVPPGANGGGRLPLADSTQTGIPGEFSELYPDRSELVPNGGGGGGDEEPVTSRRGSLTDLEIGMYALLGVFCLAILVFLINCISYAYKYRSKQLSLEGPEAMPHAHDWEGSQLLNGGFQRANSSVPGGGGGIGGGCIGGVRDHRSEPLNSPTTKRKRVKFTTFSHARKSGNGCQPAALTPLALAAKTSEIQWVCPDIELGDSQELRNYMDRLNENATKNIA
ncbi:hypothetical protein CRUP_035480 [Coryphaenoides rupestris]|nr:hypothetical protein CRUP_035480 [Coryphaenoides rupestris]